MDKNKKNPSMDKPKKTLPMDKPKTQKNLPVLKPKSKSKSSTTVLLETIVVGDEEEVCSDGCYSYEGDADWVPKKSPEDLLYDTDLEEEEPRRKLTFRDLACEDLYTLTCQQLGVIASSYFLKHLRNETISMKHHGLGPIGAKAVAAPLVTNIFVNSLDLEDNWITDEGMRDMADMLMENCNIVKLNLSSNKLGSKGARYFCEMLQENNNLEDVSVARNEFQDDDAKSFAETLKNNYKIKVLDLSGNEFCEKGGEYLGQGIAANESLVSLDLSWNHLRRRGAIGIAAGMKANITITQLDLSWNGFGDDGAKAIGEMLKYNNVLVSLDLTCNRITDTGAAGLAEGLQQNDTLRTLDISQNPITSEGAVVLMKAITISVKTVMTNLVLKGIQVGNKFHKLAEEYQKNLDASEFENEKFQFSFVVQQKEDPLNVSPHPDGDPVDLLQSFLEKKRVRLLDLFRSFDKDQSWKISPEEFRKGINSTGLRFTKRQMVRLMDTLDYDEDGQVNYQHLDQEFSRHLAIASAPERSHYNIVCKKK